MKIQPFGLSDLRQANTKMGREIVRCPKCGKPADLLRCGHCGSQLPAEQADLYGAIIKKLAKMGGNRADSTNKGGDQSQRVGNGDNTETPPGLCRWIFERLRDASVEPSVILDPCAGRGNLTKPFERSEVIAYEITLGRDFFDATRVACDLVLCNPPWSQAETWLPRIVEVVGRQTPIVYFCPAMYLIGYRRAPFRQYLESVDAPTLNSFTPLPKDAFTGAGGQGAILWLNLPGVRNVALVPSSSL